MFERIKRWTEAPCGELGPVLRARVRVQHLVVFLLNLVGLPYTKLFWGLGMTTTAAVLFVVIVSSTVALFALTRRGRPVAGGRLVSVAFFCTITVALVGRGGMTSNSAAWLLLAPVLAFMMVGPRHGMGIGVAAAVEFVGMWAVEMAGVALPAGLPVETQAWLVAFDYPIIALTISAILWVQAGIWDGVIDPAEAVPEAASRAQDTAALAGRRVLVAEDNPVNQMVIRRLLERLDLRVSLVGDGQACVEAFESSPPDIILMDCQMPLLDGYDATRALRASGARLPIVALTANTMPGDRKRCLDAGMDDHLGKPIHAQ